MHTAVRRLVGMPVRTRSGQVIGKLIDVVMELETGRLAFLLVRARGFIPGLMDQELQIAWAQVISLNEKEAIVTDGSVPSGATRLAAALTGRSLK